MARAPASYQRGPASISASILRLGVICGLSLLVHNSASRGFSPGILVFPSPQKPTLGLISINSLPNQCLSKVSLFFFFSSPQITHAFLDLSFTVSLTLHNLKEMKTNYNETKHSALAAICHFCVRQNECYLRRLSVPRILLCPAIIFFCRD